MRVLTLFNQSAPSLKFAMVGSSGFLVDIVIFFLLQEVVHLELMAARVVAFILAATSNWFFNRRFTFSNKELSGRKSIEWFKFTTSAVLSAIPNLGTFYLLMQMLPQSRVHVIAAMSCGILIGYYSNYRLASGWVFKSQAS